MNSLKQLEEAIERFAHRFPGMFPAHSVEREFLRAELAAAAQGSARDEAVSGDCSDANHSECIGCICECHAERAAKEKPK